MSTRITISSLVKRFGATTAVNGVDLEIEPGELFFLLGPSGCGKTTLLRMIAGFIDPTEGSIRFNDRDVTHAPPNKRNTGMVFQSYALWPHMTVGANVAFGLGIRKIGSDEKNTRVREALDAVQMQDYAERKPNELSGGQQQRVALARALVIRPEVLLLDEPLSNLDAKLRIELRSEIRRICKDAGITTVYVTHDQSEALSMADRIAIMREGVIQQVGTPQDLYRTPKSVFVAQFLGETNLIRARITDIRSDIAHLTSTAGDFLARASSDLQVGSNVVCSIRPEAAAAGGNGSNELGASLELVTYLGATELRRYQLRDGQRFDVARSNPDRSVETNQQFVSFNPIDVVILPDSTGRSQADAAISAVMGA